jgi:hypothetical protein
MVELIAMAYGYEVPKIKDEINPRLLHPPHYY